MAVARFEAKKVKAIDMHALFISIKNNRIDRSIGIKAAKATEEEPVGESEEGEVWVDCKQSASHDRGTCQARGDAELHRP